MIARKSLWLLIAANAIILCVLSFYRSSPAAPPGPPQVFANPISQRDAIIEQLKETNRLLREQNALLRGGQIRVVIAELEKN
jgi:hypothetical protein